MTVTDEEIDGLLKDLEKIGIKGILVTKENLEQHENMEFSEDIQEENK